MSTSSSRSVMKRITKAADVDVSDDPKNYFTLHGGGGMGLAKRTAEKRTSSKHTETGNKMFNDER